MNGHEIRGSLLLNFSSSVVDYLKKLKINFEKAADLASLTTAKNKKLMPIILTIAKELKNFKRMT